MPRKDPEEAKAWKRDYYHRTKHLLDKDQRKEYQKKYREEHAEELKAKRKEYRERKKAEDPTVFTRRWNEWYQSNKDKDANSHLRCKYGITLKEKEEMINSQGGLCAICDKPFTDKSEKGAHIDHDHTSGRLRQILCSPCNCMLGFAKDDPFVLVGALIYLGYEVPNKLRTYSLRDMHKTCEIGSKVVLWTTYANNRQRLTSKEKSCGKARTANVKRKYGITLEESLDIIKSQNYRCKVCWQPLMDDVNLDHDHQLPDVDGRISIRGALHHGCNCVLGNAYEDGEILASAIGYLLKHRKTCDETQSENISVQSA